MENAAGDTRHGVLRVLKLAGEVAAFGRLAFQHFPHLGRQGDGREGLLQEGGLCLQDTVAHHGVVGVAAYVPHAAGAARHQQAGLPLPPAER